MNTVDLNNIKGHVVVVMAPMGSGKGTIINEAKIKYPALYETVSCTSRMMRPGEVSGEHYNFVTISEFDKMIEADSFLEWAEFAGNKYGTLKNEIIPRLTKNNVVLVEIELQGVEQLLKLLPREHMTIVYIEAGGWDKLRARASARAPMSADDLKARQQRFLIEQKAKPLADVIINNSEDVETAHAEFSLVIEQAYKNII